MRHVHGEDRTQATLMPERLEDFVAADHPARVIDAFVDHLDLVALQFNKAIPKTTGRKPYNPADLLRLYLYGYLNQVHSSRKLERECQRNVELMWLMRRLAPDFKTIANFRQQHGEAITQASRAFVQFCRTAGLVTDRLVAIDGSKFKAAASKDATYTADQLSKTQAAIEQRIARYLAKLDETDAEQADTELDRSRVQAALERLTQREQALKTLDERRKAKGQSQICATEADARLMRSGRDGKVVGYNVQSAVDGDSGLIVHHEVTQEATDNTQLLPIADQVQTDSGLAQLDVVADGGYSNGEQLTACEERGIRPAVPPNRAKNNQGDVYQKADFEYDVQADQYVCPAGEVLSKTTKNTADRQWLYSRRGCNRCALQAKCTKADRRWITRHFDEEAFARSRARLRAQPDLMTQRMAIVERPFAQLKQNLGFRRYRCWGLSGARAETSLVVMVYNLQRAISHLGVPRLLEQLVKPV